MTQEVAEAPASELEVTDTPVLEEANPAEAEKPPEPPPEEERKFTQAELDAMISKRLAREQRKWEREQQAKQVAKPKAPAEVPTAEQFESTEAYADALALKKAEELVAQREAAQRHAEVMEAYANKEEEIREKYADFEQVAYNPNLRITEVMAETIRASDLGPELAYHLGSNPKEADRISKLSPFLQAKEIGRIEAKLADAPPVKKTTSAPAPISPVSSRVSSNTGVVDTTDPRSIKTMSDSEWIEADRRRLMAKMQAERNR